MPDNKVLLILFLYCCIWIFSSFVNSTFNPSKSQSQSQQQQQQQQQKHHRYQLRSSSSSAVVESVAISSRSNEQPSEYQFDESKVVIGQQLYVCSYCNSSFACNGSTNTAETGAESSPVTHCGNLNTPPLLTRSTEIEKTGKSNKITVVLTAEVKYVNLFELHYAEPWDRQNLELGLSGVKLPLQRDGETAALTEVWLFNNELPGPTIRASVGDVLEVKLRNLLPTATGFFIPGVYNVKDTIETGFVKPLQTRTFRIALTQPGTFLYQSPIDPAEQVSKGLFGALVVYSEKEPTQQKDQQQKEQQNSSSSDDDAVVVISDALIDVHNWQLWPPFRDPLKRAEEQFNGRVGNVLLVNGYSTSAGPQLNLSLTTKTDRNSHHKLLLRFLNACSSRSLRVFIPNLPFKVESSWGSLQQQEQSLETAGTADESSFFLPGGASAIVIIDQASLYSIKETLGQAFDVVVSDSRPLSERKRASFKAGAERNQDQQLSSPVLAETFTSVGGRSLKGSIVDLLLLPSNDGIIWLNGFIDSADLPAIWLPNGQTDYVASIPPCSDTRSCEQLSFGFKTRAFVPDDSELIEASLMFEVVCPVGVLLSSIDVKLFSIPFNHLTSTGFRVPDNSAIFAVPDDSLLLAHRKFYCNLKGHQEIPLNFKSAALKRFVQDSISGAAGFGKAVDGEAKDGLAWFRVRLVYSLHSFGVANSENKTLSVSTRRVVDVAPPTLRLLYRTADSTSRQGDQVYSRRPQDIKARQRRLENVVHEMAQEQESLREQLQEMYNSVMLRQEKLLSNAAAERAAVVEQQRAAAAAATVRRAEEDFAASSPLARRNVGSYTASGGVRGAATEAAASAVGTATKTETKDEDRQLPGYGDDYRSNDEDDDHKKLVEDLQTHIKQQLEQHAVEKKIHHIRQSSHLPVQYRQSLLIELQKQLQRHYLVQQIYQHQLQQRLLSMNNKQNPSDDTATAAAAQQRFLQAKSQVKQEQQLLRQAHHNSAPTASVAAESDILKEEKILYMKLYKQFSETVNQMVSLKEVMKSLETQEETESSNRAKTTTQLMGRETKSKNNEIEYKASAAAAVATVDGGVDGGVDSGSVYYEFIPVTDKDSFAALKIPQRIFKLKINGEIPYDSTAVSTSTTSDDGHPDNQRIPINNHQSSNSNSSSSADSFNAGFIRVHRAIITIPSTTTAAASITNGIHDNHQHHQHQQEVWLDSSLNRQIPVVTVTLGQSPEADRTGHVPMWIGTKVVMHSKGPPYLIPGSPVVWELINNTPLTQTLSFHRVMLRILESRNLYRNISSSNSSNSGEDAWSHRSSEIIPYNVRHSAGSRSSRNRNSNGTPLIGITLPAANSVGESVTGVYCVSSVPVFASNTATAAAAAAELTETREFHNWSIQIQSTNFEYVSNGMKTRVSFNVFSSNEINKIATANTSAADELPSAAAAAAAVKLLSSGASFNSIEDSSDEYDYDHYDYGEHKLHRAGPLPITVAAVSGCFILIAALIALRYYRSYTVGHYVLVQGKKRKSVDHNSSPTTSVINDNNNDLFGMNYKATATAFNTPKSLIHHFANERGSLHDVMTKRTTGKAGGPGESFSDPSTSGTVVDYPSGTAIAESDSAEVAQTYLQSPERNLRIKHRPAVGGGGGGAAGGGGVVSSTATINK